MYSIVIIVKYKNTFIPPILPALPQQNDGILQNNGDKKILNVEYSICTANLKRKSYHCKSRTIRKKHAKSISLFQDMHKRNQSRPLHIALMAYWSENTNYEQFTT